MNLQLLTTTMNFKVDAANPLGEITGRNVGDEDIPVGSTFTAITKTQVSGHLPHLTSIDLGVAATIQLTLKNVEFYGRNIEVIPQGHTAKLIVEGNGMGILISLLQARKAREHIFIACPT
ncbi:MAG: hypothetical protein HC895_07975 [Leptolyngbyaceae cyanobacterium SM1_3_5]|nr:hypothetical protein [Leptolyngbyaceae cyanobacterium SM1_3_5]